MKAIQDYIWAINDKYKGGNTTEPTFRSDLESLIKSIIEKKLTIINEPKKQIFGRPDFILKQENTVIGFIETKKIGDTDLEGKTTNKEQFNRYKEGALNIIFTDYLEFHFYNDGKTTKIAIAELTEKGTIKAIKTNFQKFEDAFLNFSKHQAQPIKDPENLANIMAQKARLLADTVEGLLFKNEDEHLKNEYDVFKDKLLPGLSYKDFANTYAETIAYGIFTARLEFTDNNFIKSVIGKHIPKSTPFLKVFFHHISSETDGSSIEWIINELVNIFSICDVKQILRKYDKYDKDPVIHFYETFFTKFDAITRKNRGVWYTPNSVVNFIIKAVDSILKDDFNLQGGLANTSKIKKTVYDDNQKKVTKEFHKVQILDPATGTGTFLSEIVNQIHNEYTKTQAGTWNGYVKKHLIPRLNGFELLMTSYTIAHIKLFMLLREKDKDFNFSIDDKDSKRFQIFLTNTLSDGIKKMEQYKIQGLERSIIEEAKGAQKIKQDNPVMCVIGNPPYSVSSHNKGSNFKEIEKLMEAYKKEPNSNKRLKERRTGNISDDYVKFIRYGEYLINKNETGILAFINPHNFLDGPTFRGMRWQLLKTFDKIYIIDLHGNTLKKETAPDGKTDQNVFAIMTGVSINIFIKTGNKKEENMAKVFYTDVYGVRDVKYNFLNENNLKKIDFKTLKPYAPNYYFTDVNETGKEEYLKGFAIQEIFKESGIGILTGHDKFVIKEDKGKLLEQFKNFQNTERHAKTLYQKFNVKEKKHWDILKGHDSIKDEKDLSKYIKPISYRVFDKKYIFYKEQLLGRARFKIMPNFLKGKNVGLVFCRQSKTGNNFNHIFITDKIMEGCFISNRTSEGNTIAPLYSYSTDKKEKEKLFKEDVKRTLNLKDDFIKEFSKGLSLRLTSEKSEDKNTFVPIDIMDYIYAVLHSPTYRKKYKHFLKRDFPRVPYPKKVEDFRQLVKFGSALRRLHLMEDNISFITEYPKKGNHKITNRIIAKDWVFDKETQKGRIYINDNQYFGKIPLVAWEMYIGGFQPAQKWLKDKKGKELKINDIEHYQKIIAILTKTAEITKEIDRIKIG